MGLHHLRTQGENTMKIYKLDGYDDCIAGLAEGVGLQESVICYDVDKLLARFEAEGMTRDEAIEHFEFNVRETNLGPGTPVFVSRISLERIEEIVGQDDSEGFSG